MAALHPASTHRAASDPDSKAAHDRVHDRQLFLILRCHAGRRHGAGAVGTRRRHRNGDHLIDTRRWRSVTVAPMPCPASAPAAPRRRRRRALREGGGLAFACPARQVEFVLQPVVLAAQPVALVFQPGTLAFRPLQVPPANRSIRRSSSPTRSERSGTSRLCQIPAHCTSQECSVWRVRPGNQLPATRTAPAIKVRVLMGSSLFEGFGGVGGL